MTTPISDEELSELERLEAEATRISTQEWVTKDRGFGKRPRIGIYSSAPSDMVNVSYLWDGRHESQAPKVADFIIAMRNAIKPLIQRLKHAEGERDAMATIVQRLKELPKETPEMCEARALRLQLRVDELESERDRLREALRPFAEIVYTEDVCWLKDEYKLFAHGQFRYHLPGLTVGTLRAACDAYGETAAAALAPQETDQ